MTDFANWSVGRRANLEGCLESLSDMTYQRDVWLREKPRPGIEDNFDVVVHFFFDDTQLADDVDQEVGICLVSAEAAARVRRVIAMVDAILQKYGTLLSDEEYMATTEWKAMTDEAREVYVLVKVNTPRA